MRKRQRKWHKIKIGGMKLEEMKKKRLSFSNRVKMMGNNQKEQKA